MSTSGLSGDLGELDRLADYLGGVAEAVPRIAATAAPKVQETARAEYAQNLGPSGVWPRNTSNRRYPSLARPASGVTFTAEGERIRGEGEDVLRYHMGGDQGGNPRLPKRAVFPDEGAPLPEAWAETIDEAAKVELEKGKP
jgi:hypothetical protein